MAIVRIAFAAAALYYIAPHIGGDVIKSARPVINQAKAGLSPEALTSAALSFCQSHTEDCLKFAKNAVAREAKPNDAEFRSDRQIATAPVMSVPTSGSLRGLLPENPPLPPQRPVELKSSKRS